MQFYLGLTLSPLSSLPILSPPSQPPVPLPLALETLSSFHSTYLETQTDILPESPSCAFSIFNCSSDGTSEGNTKQNEMASLDETNATAGLEGIKDLKYLQSKWLHWLENPRCSQMTSEIMAEKLSVDDIDLMKQEITDYSDVFFGSSVPHKYSIGHGASAEGYDERISSGECTNTHSAQLSSDRIPPLLQAEKSDGSQRIGESSCNSQGSETEESSEPRKDKSRDLGLNGKKNSGNHEIEVKKDTREKGLPVSGVQGNLRNEGKSKLLLKRDIKKEGVSAKLVRSCHICAKRFEKKDAVFCTFISRRRCKKAICRACIAKIGWDCRVFSDDALAERFICPHCKNVCESLQWARCYLYRSRRKSGKDEV